MRVVAGENLTLKEQRGWCLTEYLCAIKNDLCVRKSCKLRWQVSAHYLWRNPETLPSQQAVQEMGPCRDDTTCSGIWMNVEPLCQVYKGETQ